MTSRELVPAMGGVRHVPAPDAVATEYLLLALRLDQRIPGLVDGYFGPAAIKAQVDMEQGRSPVRLREDARSLRDGVAMEIPEADRRAWLDAQLVALEAQAAALAEGCRTLSMSHGAWASRRRATRTPSSMLRAPSSTGYSPGMRH